MKMLRPNMPLLFKVMLLLVIIVLLGSAAGFRRDYQDSWILEGLEIPFLLFVITYSIAFFSEKRISSMVMLAVAARTIFLLIPNLKYTWFQGVYIDQHTQYAMANHVYNEGHISSIGSSAYMATPLMHILFSTFSIILNMPVADSMKYLPIVFSSIYPLLTYLIIRKIDFSNREKILKYGLFISSVPFAIDQFLVTGTMFGILLAFLFLSNLIMILQGKNRRYWLVCTIFIFALAAAHSVTSTILTVLLLAIMVIQRLSHISSKQYLRASIVFAVVSISVTWLMFPANLTMGAISRALLFAVRGGPTPASESIPSTFFELARVDMFEAAKTFLVYYGADLFLLLLTLFGLFIMLKKLKRLNGASSFLLLFGGCAFVVILIGVLLKLGATRTLTFERLLFPVFSGIAILYMTKKRSWLCPIIFSSIIFLATIELYGCQPLIPSASLVYKDLAPSVPIGYINQVNSIYQRQVVNFAYNHISGRIASDSMTRNQMIGLLGYDFSENHLIGYYPLDPRQPKQEYNFFIIHIPGKSGILGEPAKFCTPSLILEAIYNSSIVYTNGESFILSSDNPNR